MTARVWFGMLAVGTTILVISPSMLMAAPQEPGPALPALPLDDLPVLNPGAPPPPPTPYVAPAPATAVPSRPIAVPEPSLAPMPDVAPPMLTPAPTTVVRAASLPLLADQIVATNGAFLRLFAPGAKRVPDGKKMREDAEDLQEAALKFRDAVRRNQPRRAEYHYREIVEEWGHLSSRAESVAIRSGVRRSPTLDLIRGTGAVIGQARPLVGLPGIMVLP